MRRFLGIFFLALTLAVCWKLDHQLHLGGQDMPALGRLLDPIGGCWANAESFNKDFSFENKFPHLKKEAVVWLDDRLVPHIRAANDHDLYFLEGYEHACFRLWQMDMQTRAAAGRIAELAGPGKDNAIINFDREQRRKGMVYGAERCLKMMEADPATKTMMDAYTEGVNAYIRGLRNRDYPLEYKLMGTAPEKWTNLKIALLLKLMADDLTGYTEDIPLTYLKQAMAPDLFSLLFPGRMATTKFVIPSGTKFAEPSQKQATTPAGNLFAPWESKSASSTPATAINGKLYQDQSDGIGSNNWAVSGANTKSGASILCNDPHLSLKLPSLWYEVQLQAPGINAYGVSLPGAPGIVIGFNDSVAWGFTNNYRDVKDFYSIKTIPGDPGHYVFAGKNLPYTYRVERISVKGGDDYIDSVKYTIHGPVMYDEHYKEPGGYDQPLAVCWMAHRESNELKAFYLLNRAKNYDAFVKAIMNYSCPAQNIAFADRGGNVAIWGQGQFVNKWQDQGKYIMNGADSNTLWGELIPMAENPHVYDPEQGFVFSANQCVTDSTYPYWYNGYFSYLRAWRINQVLSGLTKATVEDMFALQNDVYSVLAENVLPALTTAIDRSRLSSGQLASLDSISHWDFKLTADSKEATLFQVWWYYFYLNLWKDMPSAGQRLLPSEAVTMQACSSGLANLYGKQNMQQLATGSFISACDSVTILQKAGLGAWYMARNTTVKHLLKLPAFSYDHIKSGGWGNTVNAIKEDHGPSWRMVVEMGKEIYAYGVYPGGQSGNPGSKYYSAFLGKWEDGKYNKLLFLPDSANQTSNQLKYTLTVYP